MEDRIREIMALVDEFAAYERQNVRYHIETQLKDICAMIDRIETDAARYRWLKSAKGLELSHCEIIWTREDGGAYTSTHILSANGTRHACCETLDETIDCAMKQNLV